MQDDQNTDSGHSMTQNSSELSKPKEPPEMLCQIQSQRTLESTTLWSNEHRDPWSHLNTITTFNSEPQAYHGIYANHQTSITSAPQSCDKTMEFSYSRSHKQMMKIGSKNINKEEIHEIFQLNKTSRGKDYQMECSKSYAASSHQNSHVKHKHGRRCAKRKLSHSVDSNQNPSTASNRSALSEIIHSASKHTSGSVSEARGSYLSQDLKDSKSDAPASPGPLQEVTRFSPKSLLVESLIDQLCRLMEKDTAKQKKLYNVICDKLHQMNLIDDTYTIEEFQFMRSHYQRALYQLLAVAKSTTQTADGRSILLPLPSSNLDVDVHLRAEGVMEWSRYHHEYQELEYIAKGGFGEVYKARNKLDGGLYAIKKIFLRYQYVERFLRSLKEVKMLARLNHPNIVSYKAAWLEPLDSQAQKARMQRSSRTQCSDDTPFSVFTNNSRLPLPPAPCHVNGDSYDIVFQDSSPDIESSNCKSSSPKQRNTKKMPMSSNSEDFKKNSHKSRIRLLSELLESSSVVFEKDVIGLKSHCKQNCSESQENESDSNNKSSSDMGSVSHSADLDETDSQCTESTSDGRICPFKGKKSSNGWASEPCLSPAVIRNWATLYVQMHLCERTLRNWLDERNVNLPARPLAPDSDEGSVALTLFRKIVRGVVYIHSQGIVHHDIKPSNIFVNANLKEVQVGDFGLSCCLGNMLEPLGAGGDHRGEIGTRMYAAPEQLRGMCTPKSDVYSLGIVLLELLHPFHTDMERSKVIEKLRAGHLPNDMTNIWPNAARLMSELLVTSLSARPSADELLKRIETLLRHNVVSSDVTALLASRDETIRLLKEAVSSRDQEIAELKRKLSLFENAAPIVEMPP